MATERQIKEAQCPGSLGPCGECGQDESDFAKHVTRFAPPSFVPDGRHPFAPTVTELERDHDAEAEDAIKAAAQHEGETP